MKDFANLFNTDLGQILVMLDSEEGEPVIQIIFKRDEATLKVGAGGFTAREGEEPWDVAQAKFDAVQEDEVYAVVKNLLVRLEGIEE